MLITVDVRLDVTKYSDYGLLRLCNLGYASINLFKADQAYIVLIIIHRLIALLEYIN